MNNKCLKKTTKPKTKKLLTELNGSKEIWWTLDYKNVSNSIIKRKEANLRFGSVPEKMFQNKTRFAGRAEISIYKQMYKNQQAATLLPPTAIH